jgi:hypothetical protein
MTTEAPTLATLRSLEAAIDSANARIVALEAAADDARFALAYVDLDAEGWDAAFKRQDARRTLDVAEARVFDARVDRTRLAASIDALRDALKASGRIFTF